MGDNCTVDASVLCDNVVVGSEATLQRGCLLSFGVQVGAKHTLAPDTKLTLRELQSLESR